MSILIACSSCNKRLRVPDHAAGKRVQCPECGHIFLVESADDVVEELQVEDRIVEKPSAPARRRLAGDQAADDNVVEEATNDEDTPRPRKKTKRRKKRRTLALPFDEPDRLVWPWWVFGGGGICLVMFALLLTAVFANSGTLLKLLAIYMLMMPISTVIFFVAMYLSSVLLGAMEIGEIHVALVKAFALIFVVDLVSWFPFGNYIAFGIWLIGLMVLFRLDLWEARMLLGINWILNFAVGFFLVVAIVGGASRAGKRDRDFDRFDDGRPGRVNEWDEGDAKDRGLR